MKNFIQKSIRKSTYAMATLLSLTTIDLAHAEGALINITISWTSTPEGYGGGTYPYILTDGNNFSVSESAPLNFVKKKAQSVKFGPNGGRGCFTDISNDEYWPRNKYCFTMKRIGPKNYSVFAEEWATRGTGVTMKIQTAFNLIYDNNSCAVNVTSASRSQEETPNVMNSAVSVEKAACEFKTQ
ncbi:hypothetical protein FV228_01400 [Methylobacterium sp. WL18]|uniref:hypothetical protein n=1 Tax=Methylobacterium sp. WL18 TaxID=2603897 RepID=UPI0011CC81E6|nr:hypothetical protein [Methylobacterium sp. WL18]TXN76182.1 hypothetical protein FV228_01400 [Methylobacterium sp. WL18]